MLRRAGMLVVVVALVALYASGALGRTAGLVAEQMHAPWMKAVGAVAVVALLARAAMALRGRGESAKDPVRMYPSKVRAAVFARAGGQCEYTAWAWQRCRAQAEHADHIIPWSKGGATSLQNGAASCAHHNTSKGARLLTRRQLRALERRRRRYFPVGAVVRAGQRYGEPEETATAPARRVSPNSQRAPLAPAPGPAPAVALEEPAPSRPSWEYERPSW